MWLARTFLLASLALLAHAQTFYSQADKGTLVGYSSTESYSIPGNQASGAVTLSMYPPYRNVYGYINGISVSVYDYYGRATIEIGDSFNVTSLDPVLVYRTGLPAPPYPATLVSVTIYC